MGIIIALIIAVIVFFLIYERFLRISERECTICGTKVNIRGNGYSNKPCPHCGRKSFHAPLVTKEGAMYRIQFFGYQGSSGTFPTITQARKVLKGYKAVDKLTCHTKFKSATVTSTKDSYKISFGCNLYSAAAIVRN
jgi:predicted RNA-binding Zn-ribbon protein involved in translation (DUF1610 family)